MLDLYEKVYFAELDRKSKIQAALAFPIATSAVGVAAARYTLENAVFSTLSGCLSLALLVPPVISLVIFLLSVFTFLSGAPYKYIWTMEDFKKHYEELVVFSERYPDAPPSEDTFKANLISDLASCATHNARLNDRRSEILYRANISVFVLVLFALASSATVLLGNRL